MESPEVLVNFSLFIEGKGYAGKAKEIILPKTELNYKDHKSGGMDAPIPIDAGGGMNALQADFTIEGYDSDLLGAAGASVGTVGVIARGFLSQEPGRKIGLIATMRGKFSTSDMGTWSADSSDSMLKMTMKCSYYRLDYNGRKLIEIDAVNAIRFVDGKDQLQEMRNILLI